MMKKTITGLAGMAAALIIAGPAFAQTVSTSVSLSKTYDEDVDVFYSNDVNVDIDKFVSVRKAVDYAGTVMIEGMITADSAALALIDNKQIVNNALVSQTGVAADPAVVGDKGTSHVNEANANNQSVVNAAGNVGVNVSAGDLNLQKNATALSVIAGVSAGTSDAEIFSVQKGVLNEVRNSGVVNDSDLGNAVNDLSGNVGVNLATGVANIQKNATALSNVRGNAVLSDATSAILQESSHMLTSNTTVSNTANLVGSVINVTGNVGVNVTAGNGNIQGNSLSIASAN